MTVGRDQATLRSSQADAETKRVETPAETAPRVAGSRPARPSRKKSDEVRRALAVELHALRLQAQDTVEHYRLRVFGQLAEVLRAVEGEEAAGVEPSRLPAKTATALVTALRAVRIKPKKGRAKDLARVQALAERLVDLLPPQD